jgi:uncharacterized protein (UPF0335 family)
MTTPIQSLFARWQEMEEQKEAVREDLKELFAEADGQGFNPKALRAAFRYAASSEDEKKAASDQLEGIKIYLLELGVKPLGHAPVRARVEIIEKIPAISAPLAPRDVGPPYDDLEIPANLRQTA